jgi:hypothetical protein
MAAYLSPPAVIDDSLTGQRVQVPGTDVTRLTSRFALPGASLMTLVAFGCASLGVWRVGSDLGWAGDFVLQKGFLSHWQVWMGAAAGVQYASVRLTRYAGTVPRSDSAIKIRNTAGAEE